MKEIIASVATVGIMMMLVSPASAASGAGSPAISMDVTRADTPVEAEPCNPKDPHVDWLLCVVGELVEVPEWVWDQIDNVIDAVNDVRVKACYEYERATGDPCPL